MGCRLGSSFVEADLNDRFREGRMAALGRLQPLANVSARLAVERRVMTKDAVRLNGIRRDDAKYAAIRGRAATRACSAIMCG